MAIFPGSAITPAGGGYTIDQSLRFNDDDTAYLSRTPASAGNRKTWTYSVWVKRSNLVNGDQAIISANTDANNRLFFYWQGSGVISFYHNVGGSAVELATSAVFRDPSAWYHFVISADTTQATASDRLKFYVNGVQQTLTASTGAGYVSQNTDTQWNNTGTHYIGKKDTTAVYYDGYYAEIHSVDGQALDPSYFGETDEDYGHWKPIAYEGTYGTNGFYLDFSNSADIGEDQAGSNDWTANNLAATDVVLDTPTNNFCTLNPLSTAYSSSITLSEGNLYYYIGSVGDTYGVASTYSVNSGKWYFEANPTAGGSYLYIGIMPSTTGGLWSTTTYSLSVATGNLNTVHGFKFDLDAGTIDYTLNGSSWTSISTGVPTSTDMVIVVRSYAGGSTYLNFGQDSSFAGNKTAQNNTDANGYGDFYYAPPSGFLALCTANLPDPAVVPGENFNTVLWSGNGTSQSITGVGFQPDLVWNKHRNGTNYWNANDSVRGAGQILYQNTTSAESVGDTNHLTAFTSDGFTVAASGDVNASGGTYAAWNWKADNTSGSTNTDGSITSTVAANPDAGFSIVSYTGTGSNATVGHGLSSAPEVIICKKRNYYIDWYTYWASLGTDKTMLFTASSAYTDTIYWNDTAPTSSVFSVGTSQGTNGSAETYIAYCFHSVDGYSKFGSYTGNGSTDGPMLYLGFEPALFLAKRTDGVENWFMIDNARHPYNDGNIPRLLPNTSDAEAEDASIAGDFLSNGFKIRATQNMINTSGANYIYMAFAEFPFSVGGGIAR